MRCILFILVLSGCLQTRSQLMEKELREGNPVPAEAPMPVASNNKMMDDVRKELALLDQRIHKIEDALEQDAPDPLEKDIQALQLKIANLESELQQIQSKFHEQDKQEEQKKLAQADPVGCFQKAKSFYKSKDFESAIQLFSVFLNLSVTKNHPEATFLRGQAYFHTKQYKKAILDFSTLQEKWPKSSLVPEALFKIGQSFNAIGQNQDAKGFYQELINHYPKSSWAKKAKKLL